MHSKLKELESAHLKVLSEVKHMQAREDDALRLCKDLRQEKKEVVLAHDSLKNVLAKKDKESKLLNDEHANSKTELEKLRREFALIKQVI
jgi:chromosome segregation ATPase